MARAAGTDFLQSMRFHVVAATANSVNPFQYQEAQAGFSAVTTPEISIEVVEYHEGHHVYTHKFPGRPSVSDVTFSRGVALEDTDFFEWTIQVVEGIGGVPEDPYRADLYIYHGGQAGLPGSSVRSGPLGRYDATKGPTRAYHILEAFPIRCKLAGDLDATASDISISELDVAYERVQLVKLPAA